MPYNRVWITRRFRFTPVYSLALLGWMRKLSRAGKPAYCKRFRGGHSQSGEAAEQVARLQSWGEVVIVSVEKVRDLFR